MAKKQIKTILKTKKNEISHDVVALIQKNRIQYIEDNCKMVIDFTEDCVKMIRKNSEYEITFHFQKGASKGMIMIPQKGSLSLDVIFKKLEITDNRILIEYILHEEEYAYQIYY